MIDPTAPVPSSSLGGLNVNTAEVLVDKPVGEPVMRLQDVTVAFAGRNAVRNVSFDAHEGEITALIGPSGSGKTTLLRALNRMHDTVRSATVTGSVKLGADRCLRQFDRCRRCCAAGSGWSSSGPIRSRP